MDNEHSSTVQGFRKPISETLVENFAYISGKTKEARAWQAGYMSALYALRSNCLPPAYCASDDVRQVQAGISLAIIRLENKGAEVRA